jgi:hypothetical protein
MCGQLPATVALPPRKELALKYGVGCLEWAPEKYSFVSAGIGTFKPPSYCSQPNHYAYWASSVWWIQTLFSQVQWRHSAQTTFASVALCIWAARYEGWPESIQPFWISPEPVAWPWCNLAASQRRPYCASVGLVSRQWDAVDRACVLCDRRIHNERASRSASWRQRSCPFYSSRAGLSGKTSHHPGLSAPLQPRFGSLKLTAFSIAKIAVEKEGICECDGHTVHKLSKRRLTAIWLAPARMAVHGCTVRSPLTGCQVTSRIRDRFSRFSKWLGTFRTALVHLL